MKIAFLGFKNSFSFDHIGGTDSIVRRMALRLAELGDETGLISYGCSQNTCQRLTERIKISKFKTLSDSLEALKQQYEHVITVYLKPADRLAYAMFRKSQQHGMRFHRFYMDWNESPLKRRLLFAEARLFPFNGYLFCVSPRIYRGVSKWAPCSTLFLPPVSGTYFCNPEDKPYNRKLRITYAGRLDPGKGTGRAIEVFRRLRGHPDIQTRLYGFAWSHKPETVQLHERLLSAPDIIYEPSDFQGWTPEVDENLRQMLRQTDILLLPYRKLSSTVDTPLLLLEGMANLCAIITPPLGDLQETYGASDFNLKHEWDTDSVVNLIENARLHLAAEKQRLLLRNTSLQFDAKSVTERFRSLLLGSS
jgi:glycosyltransferase involved in cell wall biosynthesis